MLLFDALTLLPPLLLVLLLLLLLLLPLLFAVVCLGLLLWCNTAVSWCWSGTHNDSAQVQQQAK